MLDGSAPARSSTLILVMLAALSLRCALPIASHLTTGNKSLFYTPDSEGYIGLAQNLLSEGQFTRFGKPEMDRTPGYPVLVVPGVLLGNVEAVTIALQIVMSCLTVFLVYHLSLLLFRRNDAALCSAALYAVEPLSILYASLIMTETVFSLALVLFCYLLARYMAEPGIAKIVGAGLAACAGVFVRPIIYLLPACTALALMGRSVFTGRALGKTAGHALIFLAVSMVPMVCWQARNWIETGYSGFSSLPPKNIYYWQAGAVIADQRGVSQEENISYMEELLYRNHP